MRTSHFCLAYVGKGLIQRIGGIGCQKTEQGTCFQVGIPVWGFLAIMTIYSPRSRQTGSMLLRVEGTVSPGLKEDHMKC